MTEEIIIAKMTPEDVDAVVNIGLETPEVLIDPSNPYYYDKPSLANFVSKDYNVALVAKHKGRVVGFEIVYFNQEMGDAYFADIAIVKEYRDMGIGKRLYEEATKILKELGCRWIWAICEEDNVNMQKFFDKRGFKRGRKYFFQYKVLD